jgi:PLP dependent protein
VSEAASVGERLAIVTARMRAAALAAGRRPESVRLVAVSKGQAASAIRAAHAAGQRDFGENYVQELASKAGELADLEGITWHAIGRIQRNKARDVMKIAAFVHTVDRPELARELEHRGPEGARRSALVEVNVGSEPQKGGCAPAELATLLDVLAGCRHLHVVGLMTIPPETEDAEGARPFFAALRELRDRHGGPAALPELSMGMSHDFEIAIAEGATLVRVGTAIFGPRARPAAAESA